MKVYERSMKFWGCQNVNGDNQIMDEKRCTKCGEVKGIQDFYIDRTKSRSKSSQCKSCINKTQSIYRRTSQYKARVNGYTATRRKKTKERLIKERGGKCEKCGETFDISCFDFHHQKQREKDYPIGQMLTWGNLKLQEELKKCIMVCANCHRILHKGHYLINIGSGK